MTNRSDSKKIWIDRSLLLSLVAGAFALGIFAGSGVGMFTSSLADKGEVVRESREGTFRFIRAFVESNAPGKDHLASELKPFQYKVNALIENSLKSGSAAAVSVYFRDLNNGNWFGIREHEKFSPKSLLKVPLMIAYFKWAESSPLVLRKTLTYSGKDIGAGQDHGVHVNGLDLGKSYTVNDLIFRMIVHDDMAAYSLLYANLPPGRLDKVFKDLYVEYDPQKQEDSLSLNAFAAFYRVLYNSSYLSEEMSEKALRYLSKSSFRNGMVSGVPPNIEIASKQGERTITTSKEGEQQEFQQLHEFGIIYHPNRPFLLGVMTRGNDVEHLAKVIRDITRLVYEEVDKQS
ncbi:MAG TPA: serine hydrolase [Candidatus Sulfobium mesophilum]|nr:serine hydrolase [Candidatus Sulfobium mesophilum]